VSGVTGNLLEVRDLSVRFETPSGPVRAVRGVSLVVPPRSIVGLVGESGSGKTTVVSTVINLLTPNAVVEGGEILYKGRDVLRLSPEELRALRGREIAMVFQDPMTALSPVHTVATHMIDVLYREAGQSALAKRARAVEMLRRVGIPDPEERIDHYPHQFSGGMRQRIAIAMALLVNPGLLIADEPTTSLDVTLEAQIIHLLRELRSTFNGSILFVSHNLGLIAELCDSVVVMYAGEVLESGSVHDVFHRPSHPYTRRLLECDPARVAADWSGALPTIPGDVPDLIRLPPGCVFAPRCESAIARCGSDRPEAICVGPEHVARCHLLVPAGG
jgi:oligopeptide/dipeptide ABC transporter ATP-binding protein